MTDQFDRYRVTIRFTAKLMGGVPRDPKIVEGWLRSKAGFKEADEIRLTMIRTLAEEGAQLTPESTIDEIIAASEKLAGTRETVGFKRMCLACGSTAIGVDPCLVQDKHDISLYIEGRQLKAMIKECANIVFLGQVFGTYKKKRSEEETGGKQAKSFLAERVFVVENVIPLGVAEPDGIETVIGHIIGAQGPRSTIGYHEYVAKPTITFHVDALAKSLTEEQWFQLWDHAQRNGIGAMRSQGHGEFELIAFDPVHTGDRQLVGAV